jgi:hypothetical protein
MVDDFILRTTMKIAVGIAATILCLDIAGRAETLDTAVADGWFVALGSSGDVWYHPNDCGYSDWRYLMNFPGGLSCRFPIHLRGGCAV